MSFLLPAALAKHFSGGSGNKPTDAHKRSGTGGPVKASRSAAPTAARLFTAEEVAAHATESDCYTVVEGKVYDVTRYLRLHPGGFKLLYKNAGGDSTSDFLALRHSAKSRVILEQYYVGELAQPGQTRRLAVPGQAAGAGAGAGPEASAAASSASQQSANDGSMPPPAPVARKVGSMVGPQQFLGVAPSHAASGASSGGSVTPSTTALAGVYPPPRANALHASTSHPDRLSAYTTQKQQQLHSSSGSGSSNSSIPIVSSSALSINLQPPTVAPTPPRSKPRTPCPVRSPTSLALERHLSNERALLTPPEDSERMQDEPALAQEQFPSFQQPAMPPAAASSTVALSSSAASSTVSAASAASSVVASISAFGPRRFVLRRREQQTARDVQLLVFEPLFSDSAASGASSSSSAASAVSASTAAASSAAAAAAAHPSALDPAFWLRVPPGLHISIGLTLTSGAYEKRPYTPTANSQGCFELLVKAYAAGIVSRALHALPLGSAVDVFGPAGRFDYESEVRARKHWIMIAQGTGITPFWQLIKHVRAEAATASHDGSESMLAESTRAARDLRLYLLDCNRDESDVLLRDELTTLEAESGGQLVVRHVISKPRGDVASPHETGRLNAKMLGRFLVPLWTNAASSAASASAVAALATLAPAPASSSSPSPYLFLLCGSDEFHTDVSQMLQQTQGIREQDIFMF